MGLLHVIPPTVNTQNQQCFIEDKIQERKKSSCAGTGRKVNDKELTVPMELAPLPRLTSFSHTFGTGLFKLKMRAAITWENQRGRPAFSKLSSFCVIIWKLLVYRVGGPSY